MMMPFCCVIGGGSHVTVAERELLATAVKFCGYDVGTVETKSQNCKKGTFRLYLFKYSECQRTRSVQILHGDIDLNI